MPGPSALPPDLTNRPFTVGEALARGISADVLRGARFSTPFPGVRVPAALGASLEVRCRALACLLPLAAVSHGTAAQLYNLPLPQRMLGHPLHVCQPVGRRATRINGVAGHAGLIESDVQQLRSGLRIVRAAVVWAQLAADLPVEDLVVLGDAVLARGLASLAQLADDTDARRHRRGCSTMRRALPLLEPLSDSPMETRLRLLLVRHGLSRPVANRDVVHQGEWLARPDLSYPQWRIAIEYEGDHHRTDRRQWKRDKTRRRLLEDAGWPLGVRAAIVEWSRCGQRWGVGCPDRDHSTVKLLVAGGLVAGFLGPFAGGGLEP